MPCHYQRNFNGDIFIVDIALSYYWLVQMKKIVYLDLI